MQRRKKRIAGIAVVLGVLGGLLGVVTVGGAQAGGADTKAVHCVNSSGLTYNDSPWRAHYPSYLMSNGYPTLNCILTPGDRGLGVKELQIALQFCNIPDPGPVDGIYGTKTKNAVAWTQGATGLPVDGKYGPQTREQMHFRAVHDDNGRTMCVKGSP